MLSQPQALHSIAEAYAPILHSSRELLIRDHGRFSPLVSEEDMRRGVARTVIEGRHFKLGSADRDLQALLFDEARVRRPKTVIEFGTCFGVSAAALAFGMVEGRLITIEADPVLAGLARATLDVLGLGWVEVHQGTFAEVLPTLELADVGLVFDDGDHTGTGERARFFEVLPSCAAGTRFIWDDIQWSKEMLTWWREVSGMPGVSEVRESWRAGALTWGGCG